MMEWIPADWREALGDRLAAMDLEALSQFVAVERTIDEVFPPEGRIFEALRLTPFDAVRAVIIGQDPYHEPGQAHGLAFSSQGDRPPRSLQNILKELRDDCGYGWAPDGSLQAWAAHGVLLLNTVLTVRRGKPNSHAGHGWEQVTSAIVDTVATKPGPIVFMLWGKMAQTKGRLIDRERHVVIECSHPSPFSARLGFLGKKPFSRANEALAKLDQAPIDWRLE